MPNAHEALGQDVQEEAPHAFLHFQGHDVTGVSPVRVAPLEGDLAMVEGHEAVMAEGDAVGRPAEGVQDLGGRAQGSLGIDDPVVRAELLQEACKARRGTEALEGVRALECPPVLGVGQGLEGLAAEDPRERLDGKEKVSALRGHPPVPCRCQGPASHHTVDMEVVVEHLVPGVQPQGEPQFAPEPCGIPAKGLQGLRGTLA